MNSLHEKFLQRSRSAIGSVRSTEAIGRLTEAQGMITASLPASLGELVQIEGAVGEPSLAEVIGFSGDLVQLMPFSTTDFLKRGDRVRASGQRMKIPVGFGLLGRVINSIGEPIDGKGPLQSSGSKAVGIAPPNALARNPIDKVFTTGQRVIDGLLTMGKGQRVGLFAGSGVGKSTLLGQVARFADSDCNVVALIGERGREVLPFIHDSLGAEGMAKSVVIVSTANESPLARVRAAETAVSISDWFRQQNRDVLLMLDSLTRFAMAQRDIGLMLGEPPTSRGYTPSVFQKLADLLERLGSSDRGSITGLLTVLVEGDDMNDPIADAARSILDGHIVLDRKLAHAGHYPPVNVLESVSRVFHDLAQPEHVANALTIRQLLSKYLDVIDLVQVGAYSPGSSAETDLALAMYPRICQFLQQGLQSPTDLPETLAQMMALMSTTATSNDSVAPNSEQQL
jgi:flagellum-specific ATP synthase